MANNKKMDGWLSSMETMLGSVNYHCVKVSSISYVPEQLRNTRKEAYMPQVVSIGPLHRQTRRELLHMEEIKWRCMRFLLYRTIGTPEPLKCLEKCLRKCSEAIYKLDEVVRAAYTDPIKLNDYDLAKIMLLDGCFLLELLISNSKKLDTKLRSVFNEGKPSPGAEVVKNELVLSDLKLLENQIPFFILTKLFETLFHKEAQSDEGFRMIVNDKALSLFGFHKSSTSVDDGSSKSMITRVDDGSSSSKSMNTPVDDGSSRSNTPVPNCAHFLELVHWFMTRKEGNLDPKKEGREVENNHHVSITVDGNGSTEPKQTLELKHCAARLEAVGVTIAPLDSDPKKGGSNSKSERVENGKEIITFGCDIEFSKTSKGGNITETTSRGSNKNLEIHPLRAPLHTTETTSKGSNKNLKIHPLHITETTEVQWRNLIAWEQNRIAHERFLKVENQTRCKFSQYALLFKDLVCCEHDIQLLENGEVLQQVGNGEKRSKEDLMTLFKEMAKGIDVDRSRDESYRQLLEGLNECSGTKCNRKILSHHWESFKAKTRYMCRDLLEILKREYTPNMWKTLGVIAAIILLVLTVAQTILAAISL